ncbi:hypothetical protein ACFWJM_29130 [Streptomyces sp. NPDC127077]|uniref:hypothetical protein n=1 Tax=Streptomyces sp. NPDC127077 TaxID=3347131 RepID=UPI0036543038
MSTERPDNDATDPAGSHAEGPAEEATENTAEAARETAADPAGNRAENAVADPADSTAKDPAEVPAGDHTEDRTTAAPAGDRAEDHAEVVAAGDRAEGAAEVPAGDRAEAPAQDAAGGEVEDAAEAAAPGTRDSVADSAEEADAGSGEDSGEQADAGSGEDSLGSAALPASPEGSDAGVPEGSGDGGAGEGSGGEHSEVAVLGNGSGTVAGDGAGGGRRRNTPVLVASVVAAVLLVGGGGAWFATTASGGGRSGTPGADGTPPPLALDGYAASTTGDGSTGGTAGIAPGEPDPYGTTYRASGTLPAGPGSAHVQWAEGRVSRAEVARLAKALGLAGTPRLAGDAWTVGTAKDGTEPNLRVTADAPGTWTYSSALPGGDNCVKVTVCESVGSGSSDSGSSGSGSSAGSAPGPVSEAAAKKAAAPVLKAVGQDDAKLDASQLMDRVRVVNADPVVGGLPTYGWTTGLRIGADGHVVGGSGQLKTPVEGDAYPVVTARKALDEMNGSASATGGDRRMGIGGCASPVPLKDRDEKPCEHPSPEPGAAVTVEKATFGLAAQRANGRQALVPSWLFEVRAPGAQDTYTVTHPAVDPAFLASPESPAPPSAKPTLPAPSGEPSSPAATRDVAVEGYTADGRDLTVSFTGGVCAHYTVSVSESSGKVTVTVTAKPWKNKVCIMIAKFYEKTVRLDEPLGGRAVVGSDGKAVHHGRAGIPETSGAASAEPR